MRVTLMGQPYENVTLDRSGHYIDGSPALVLNDETGERLAVATVYLQGVQPSEGCVWIKNWSENEGMLSSLIEAGIVEATGRVEQAGYVHAFEARLIEHQPREHSVLCVKCLTRQTWRLDAVCASCTEEGR